VLDILLHKDAKIIDADELTRKMNELRATQYRIEREIYGTRPDGSYARAWESLSENEQAILTQIEDYQAVIYEDPGRFATMLGYDAISVKNPMVNHMTQEKLSDTFYVVLNRGALAVRSI